jgi:Ca-activated chloride channel homolog
VRATDPAPRARCRLAPLLVIAAALTLPGGARQAQGVDSAPPAPQAPAQAPTFSTRTEAVRIDVLVSENGRPVLGLQPGDFEVRDNRVLQRVDLVSFDQVPLTVVFAFDVSESVRGQRLLDLRAAARSALDALRPEDEAALVTFSAAVARPCDATLEHQCIAAALVRVAPGGGTALVDAVYAGMKVGARETSRVLMIVFSDGLDVSSWLTPEAVIQAARRADVVAYAVTVGQQSNSFPRGPDYERALSRVLDSERFLKQMADVTGGKVLELESTRNLDTVLSSILGEFRQRYLIGYVPRNVSRDGWHDLQVSVRGRQGATVRARSGYQAR